MATPKQIPDVILHLANKLLDYLSVTRRAMSGDRECRLAATSQLPIHCPGTQSTAEVRSSLGKHVVEYIGKAETIGRQTSCQQAQHAKLCSDQFQNL